MGKNSLKMKGSSCQTRTGTTCRTDISDMAARTDMTDRSMIRMNEACMMADLTDMTDMDMAGRNMAHLSEACMIMARTTMVRTIMACTAMACEAMGRMSMTVNQTNTTARAA